MTEIERAIEFFETVLENRAKPSGEEPEQDGVKQIETAITALQEKQEREKGCEHCRQGKEFYVMQYGEQIAKAFIHTCSDGDALFIEGDDMSYIDLDYCPKCGRPFLELPKED